ncbi:right-handed parallel beta-helix repeat-containing protein [Paractinoplanes lichenicola]|uniref:Right-handed parallel beta-helix repeat-containing protein n=1 Tax=Paractinoplanes lichenicola TaxID=2802976 RepID=A0ABS1W4X5_9ACTN|nr:right-handed parallel beta-helix repeat-containing protein [Actinoplanes lichenicola]MBL7261801.1 right-handed parallel beta-helix repeat-containing protein [Actinoplanes lichenicola]
MSGAHHRSKRSSHRAPAGTRRRWLGLLMVLLLGGTAAAGYRAYFYEGPPDVEAAGPGLWVSTRGSDDADGSPEKPWKSISHAVEVAPAGSKIFVREGTYAPFTVSRPNLTVGSAPGEEATVEGVAGVRDGILVAATGTTIADLTVQKCVPKPNADVNINGDHGSGIRVHKTSKVTIRGVTVRDSHGENSAGLPVGCYGILVTDSNDVRVTGSKVHNNGAGIGVTGGGRGVLVDGNDVHDQDRIIQNTKQDGDDFGGYGLSATFLTAKPGPVFRNNTVRRNHGPSEDYGIDGGGMEIYDAANVTITGNTFEANDGVMETGTGNGGGCANNVFSDNKAIGGTQSGFENDTGMVLRCAAGMTVSNNTFADMKKFTFLLATGSDFAGSIEGLKINGNTVTRNDSVPIFRLQIDGGASPNMTIDKNNYETGDNNFSILNGSFTEASVPYDEWVSRTGFDKASTLKR